MPAAVWPGTSAVDGEDLPLIGDALQRVRPPVLERDPRADDEVLHSPGDEDLPRPGQSGNAGADVDTHASDVSVSEFHFPGVHTGADVDVELANSVPDGPGRGDAGRRTVEGREQSVARRLDEPPTPLGHSIGGHGIVLVEQVTPCVIAYLRGELG